MADCGATGSALDQISRALFNEDSAKRMSSLVGQAASGSLHHAAMPEMAPDYMYLPPTNQHHVAAQATTVAPHFHTHQKHSVVAASRPQLMQHHQQHLLYQQQQSLHAQQQHIMHMQHMINQQNQKKEWHEGLEDEAKEALQEHLAGHEGIVNGASVEELMAAWTEAQNELEHVYETEVEAAANMWSGYDQDAQNEAYQFTNTDDVPERPQDTNWMEEGMKYFREGDIARAIRAFEMELQHKDQDNALAWRMLGKCHAENDEDQKAIVCLEQAVERDPFAPEAHLALGVSYVNELDHRKALDSLKAWIKNNPKYAGIEVHPANDLYGSAESKSEQESMFDEAQQLLLSALDRSDGEEVASVWEALGVIYNVSKDYEAAVDAFKRALQTHPHDYQLLNKIGATLANSNQSEQALPYYEEALKRRPRYARAWLNKAISHANIRQYDEASRCYLETLSLNPNAFHCWSYLRISLSCAERWDLIPLAASQDLEAFREHFTFGK